MNHQDLNQIMEAYDFEESGLLMILQDIQDREKYLPRPDLEYVAEKLQVPIARLYNLATFYRAFSLEPRGIKHFSVCMGTACHVRGSTRLVEKLESDLTVTSGHTSTDGKYSLETVNCVGACALGPIVVINDEYHGHLDSGKLNKIVRKIKREVEKGSN